MRRLIALAIVAILVAAPTDLALLVRRSRRARRTRSCGFDAKGIGIAVRASKGVTCGFAQRMMEELLLGSRQSYPHGYTAHPKCRLYGFHCSTRSFDRGAASDGRCVKGRLLATGTAGP